MPSERPYLKRYSRGQQGRQPIWHLTCTHTCTGECTHVHYTRIHHTHASVIVRKPGITAISCASCPCALSPVSETVQKGLARCFSERPRKSIPNWMAPNNWNLFPHSSVSPRPPGPWAHEATPTVLKAESTKSSSSVMAKLGCWHTWEESPPLRHLPASGWQCLESRSLQVGQHAVDGIIRRPMGLEVEGC